MRSYLLITLRNVFVIFCPSGYFCLCMEMIVEPEADKVLTRVKRDVILKGSS